MIGKLFREAHLMMRSWWLHDRIRVSPLEGKLLRIQKGDLLQVGETQAEVIDRSVIDSAEGCTLSFHCWTTTGESVLQIELTTEGQLSAILWKENDCWRELSSFDLEIWLRNHGA